MPLLINPEHYPDIRSAIDVSLTADDLPAVVIGGLLYGVAADAEIKRRDPQWQTRTGTDQLNLLAAAVLLTAAYIAPALPQLNSERWPEGYSYERQTDYDGRAAELRSRALGLIDQIVNPDNPQAAMPPFFAKACGRRGL